MAFQTRFENLDPVVGIYTDWATNYSTPAMHPVNGYDINVNTRTVTVNYMDDSTPAIAIASSKPYMVGEGAPFRLEDKDIPVIKNYPYIGWAEGSVKPELNTTTICTGSVISDTKVYLIYQTITSLTVSNTVDDPYTFKNKPFTFTVTLTGRNGASLPTTKEFNTIITTPGQDTTYGTLKFTSGSATFQLMHGQEIEILGVSLSGTFRIVETVINGYEVFYTDHQDNITPDSEVESNDTGEKRTLPMRPMSMSRKISFRTKMRGVPETGLDSNMANLFGLSMLVGTGGLAYAIYAHLIRKLKRRLIWRRIVGGNEEEKEAP